MLYEERLKETLKGLNLETKTITTPNNASEIIPLIDSIKDLVTEIPESDDDKWDQTFVVPTPIGNLDDITIRAIDTLKNSDLILSEDTRHAKKLLSHYKISTKVKSYHLNNEHKKVNEYVELMLNGKTISLITDAGTHVINPDFYWLGNQSKMELRLHVYQVQRL